LGRKVLAELPSSSPSDDRGGGVKADVAIVVAVAEPVFVVEPECDGWAGDAGAGDDADADFVISCGFAEDARFSAQLDSFGPDSCGAGFSDSGEESLAFRIVEHAISVESFDDGDDIWGSVGGQGAKSLGVKAQKSGFFCSDEGAFGGQLMQSVAKAKEAIGAEGPRWRAGDGAFHAAFSDEEDHRGLFAWEV